MVKKDEDYKKRIERSVSAVNENESEFYISDFIENNINLYVKAKQEYVDSFTPVILAGGHNTRFGEVSKPLQTIMGTPSVVRIIKQLKKAGFREEDIYVVTALSNDYRSEPFWYFQEGDGKNMKINQVTFHDEPLGMAGVVKRFADGHIEEAKYGYNGEWGFREKQPILKNNLLVLGADTVFYSPAPMLWFTEVGGETLKNPSNGYCIFEMLGMESQNYQIFSVPGEKDDSDIVLMREKMPLPKTLSKRHNIAYYHFDKMVKAGELSRKIDFDYVIRKNVCGYAINREEYSKLEMPKDDVKIENFIGKAMEKNGKTGKCTMLDCHFFNINDMALYNTAIYLELKKRNLVDAKEFDIFSYPQELASSKRGAEYERTGREASCESGLEAYSDGKLKDIDLHCVYGLPEKRGPNFNKDMNTLLMSEMHLYIGMIINADESDFASMVLKRMAREEIDHRICHSEETAPKIREYIEEAIELGKKKRGSG